MEFEGRRRAGKVPNLTPLIDVVFLLLVFFMLTAHFVKDESILLELPEAESAAAHDEEKGVMVMIDAEGCAHMNGEKVEMESLEERLKGELAGKKNKAVTIKGDRHICLGDTVCVLDAARKAGAESVDLITRKP